MTIEQIILKSLEIASQEIKRELIDEGHNHSGKLIESLESKVNKIGLGIRGELFMLERYQYVNNYTPGSRIPFSGRTGSGGTSKYIQALIEYFKSKGADNPTRAAFATAYKQKKEGRPTKGSYLFSKNGRRLGFLEASLDVVEDRIYTYLADEIERFFEISVINKAA